MTVVEPENRAEIGQDTSLLVVDDDRPFLNRFCRAMESRGFAVRSAQTVAEGIREIRASAPAYAVVDMRLEDGNGLDVVQLLNEVRPDSRVIVLTGVRQHYDSRCGGQDGCGGLSGEAGRCG